MVAKISLSARAPIVNTDDVYLSTTLFFHRFSSLLVRTHRSEFFVYYLLHDFLLNLPTAKAGGF